MRKSTQQKRGWIVYKHDNEEINLERRVLSKNAYRQTDGTFYNLTRVRTGTRNKKLLSIWLSVLGYGILDIAYYIGYWILRYWIFPATLALPLRKGYGVPEMLVAFWGERRH